MHQRINKLLLIILTSVLMLASCNKGPMDGIVSPINEININGIAATYPVTLGESLQIKPTLTFTKDSKEYSYEWIINKTTESVLDTLVIGRGLELNAIIEKIQPGEYKSYYRVKDLTSGVTWSKSFTIQINSPVGKGWMVLSEVSGGSRLDMLAITGTTVNPIYDVLGFMKSSLKLAGTPVNVTCMNPIGGTGTYNIIVSTKGNGSTRIDPETFDWKMTDRLSYNMLAPGIPSDYLADSILPTTPAVPSLGSSILYKAGDVYNCPFGESYFGLPVNYINGIPFKVSKYITRFLEYDITNKRFVAIGNTSCTLIPASSSTLFNYNNVGKELVYMTQSFYNNTTGSNLGGETWAILKDATTFYLARTENRTFTQRYYATMNATDLDKASRFALSPVYGFLYYTVGNKIYKYDFTKDQSTLMLDLGSQIITYFDCQPFMINPTGAPLEEQKKLIVGTYDPSKPEGSNGKLEFYSIGAVNTPLTVESSYTGFGRIRSVSYRQR